MIKLIDLYCGAGGAAMGYYRAAQELGIEIEITGIDIFDQPAYPFNFIQADALEFFREHYSEYTHVHASPPCQAYSNSTAPAMAKGKQYPDLIDPTRQLLIQSGLPAVIENVSNAPLRGDIVLKGYVFGLKVIRKRKFELIAWFMMQPLLERPIGTVKAGDYISVYGSGHFIDKKGLSEPKFKKNSVFETWSYAMGIDWMHTNRELAESIPPAYTNYIGKEFFKPKITP